MRNNSHINVLLGSENAAKRGATQAEVGRVLKRQTYVTMVDAPSLVSATPFGDSEAIAGCQNRLAFLRSHSKFCQSDYILALEGAIEKTKSGTFLFGWAILEDARTGRQGKGCSAKVEVPPKLSSYLTNQKSLSDEALKFYRIEDTASFYREGTNGIITNGIFGRSDEFCTAIRCALGYLLNEKNFQEQLNNARGQQGVGAT